MSRVFISYAHEDRDSALHLYGELRKVGLQPWIDVEDLIGGQNWRLAVGEAIRSSSHFVALVSRNSVSKRGYVQKELLDAMEVLRQIPPGQIYLVPVRLDESIPSHQALADLHWIDLFSSTTQGLKRLLRALGAAEPAAATPDFPDKQDFTSKPPPEIMDVIRSRAEHDFPIDFLTRRYRLDTELKAWRDLQIFSPRDIPPDVLQLITSRAKADFPDDFSTRLHRIDTEVEAWRTLSRLSIPEVPTRIAEIIIERAERDFPNDFSTRLYRINSEVEAWLALQYEKGAPND